MIVLRGEENKGIQDELKEKSLKQYVKEAEEATEFSCEKRPYLLYHLTDHVYLRPKTVITILLRIRQPHEQINRKKP